MCSSYILEQLIIQLFQETAIIQKIIHKYLAQAYQVEVLVEVTFRPGLPWQMEQLLHISTRWNV